MSMNTTTKQNNAAMAAESEMAAALAADAPRVPRAHEVAPRPPRKEAQQRARAPDLRRPQPPRPCFL